MTPRRRQLQQFPPIRPSRSPVPLFWFLLGAASILYATTKVGRVEALSHPSARPMPTQTTSRTETNGGRNRNRNRNHKLLIIGLGRVGLEVADQLVGTKMGEDNCKVEVFGTVRAVTASTEGDTEELDTNQPIRIPFDPVVVRKHLMGDNCNDTDEDKDSNETTATDGVGIAPASHVLFSVPLPRDADPVLESVLESVAEWWGQDEHEREHEHEHEHEHGVNADNKVLGLLSTTGVYGNHDGGVVTEESELLCSETSNAHLYRSLEDDWIDLTTMTTGKPHRRFCVFRCAGIYDSSRSALHTVYKMLNEGSPLGPIPPTPGNKTNRIHATDLARGIISGLFSRSSQTNNNNNNNNNNIESSGDDNQHEQASDNSAVRIYNLADNLPESRAVVLAHASELLSSIGIGIPGAEKEEEGRVVSSESESESELESNLATTASASTSLPSRSSARRQRRRERESKIVCNQRMRDELLPALAFPTYKEGLEAILNEPETPWQKQLQQQQQRDCDERE